MSKRIVPMVISATLVMAMFAFTILSPRASAQDDGVPSAVEELALQGVESNEDWEPYVQEFDGVEMVLVPAGCFTMGTTDEQVEDTGLRRTPQDEQPANQQCFDQPFWIDRYEVTNAQFAQFDGVAASESRWSDDTLPRETIDWFEARDFCALRGGHLPTEAEWEYAARGPDNLIFPWGNTFIAENVFYVVYKDNPESTTAEVGSKPGGASWVGALDMSGNVGEWTSSIFMDYPYDATDGREEENNDRGFPRVLRGGSYNLDADSLRAAARTGRQYTPLSKGYLHGTRCVRSFDGISREGAMSSGQDEQGVTVSLTPFESNPVLTVGEPGAWDSGGVREPRVFYHDGMFHMLYMGWSDAEPARSLGYATSEDGLRWTKYEDNPVFVLGEPYSSCGFQNQTTALDEDVWVMYLTPCEGPERWVSKTLLRATAPTLSGPWTVEQTLSLPAGEVFDWDAGGYTVQSVFHTDAGYVLYFGTDQWRVPMGIGRATSADGVTWTKYNDPATERREYQSSDPVLGGAVIGGTVWDGRVTISPVVLQDDQGWQMFYGGGRGGAHTSIGYATSADGIVWNRVGDAPVLDIPGWGVWVSSAVVVDDIYYVYFSMWESDGQVTLPLPIGVATGTVTRE